MTKFLTYPSVSATIFDVPEPKDIAGKFIYNYFLPDERESTDTFVSPASFASHRNTYARQNEITFSPITAIIPDSPVLSEIQISDTKKRRILLKNTDKILKETEFMNSGYVSIKLQDATVSTRLLANAEATLLQKGISANSLSPLEVMLKYASETSDNIDGQSILDSVNVDDLNEYVSIDPVTGEQFDVQKSGDISNLTFNVVLSKKFAGDIALSAVKTPLSPAGDIFSSIVTTLSDDQSAARSGASDSRVIRTSDFVQTFDPIQIEKIGFGDTFLGGNTIMGYHIRRYDVNDPEDISDFYITNTSATNFIDNEILYGTTYNYSIAVVYLIRLFTYSKKNVCAADILVESRESPSINVTTKEANPPNAPDGLDFYLLQNKNLVIEWDFPVNPTGDIKRFQIFRRTSIDEPFSLISELDFDDSTILTTRKENVPRQLSRRIKVPRTYASDPEFDLNSKYIYAVCAIDAHDLSSSYSEQFLVSFDILTAQLVIEMISEKNAPKPYPNFLLRNQLTKDAIHDSNHSSLTCYFDPEYLKIYKGSEEIGFLQESSTDPSYKIQLIHLNFQQSVVADINVK